MARFGRGVPPSTQILGGGFGDTSVAVLSTETGTGTDASLVAAALASTDTGAGVDTSLVLLFSTDSGTGVDSSAAPVAIVPSSIVVGTQAQPVSAPPYQLLIGAPGSAHGVDITTIVPWDSIRIEENGNHDNATMAFTIEDKALAYAGIRGEWTVLFRHGGAEAFRGYMSDVDPQIRVVHAGVQVQCRDFGTLMDRLVITADQKRSNGESDRARIAWLFAQAWAQPMLGQGFDAVKKVQTLSSSMPNQTFKAGTTVRQALERILSAASDSSDYYIDYRPWLHTLDDAHTESGTAAPWNVNLTPWPSVSEVAPESFRFDWHSDGRRGGLYVRGKNAAGSGYVTDRSLGMAGPFSNEIFGRADDLFQAPDADTSGKRDRAAKAVLRDVRNPVYQGSFTVTEPYIASGSNRWQGGQLVYITSPEHGLNGTGADAGPWAGSNGGIALQPFRITQVTTTYVNGQGFRQMEITIGSRRRALYSLGG